MRTMSKFLVTIYGVDSIETQGYTRVHDTLTCPEYPTDEDVLAAIEDHYGVVYFADFEVEEVDANH